MLAVAREVYISPEVKIADAMKFESHQPLPKSRKESERGRQRRKYGPFTRRLWTDREDEAIVNLTERYGVKKWTLIAKKLQDEYQIHGRSGKQCRERYSFI